MSKKLTDKDFCDAAEEIGCKVSAIKALAMVESGGRGGFDEKGRLLIRFEGHKFRAFTDGKYDKTHPEVSYRYHRTHKTCGKNHGYGGFNAAFKLDPLAAMLSISVGMFQPMGFNHEEMGYETVGEMIDDFKKGEREQLMAFVRLIKKWGLSDELRRATPKDFAVIAKRYNGADYESNNYDGKMVAYNKQFDKEKIDCQNIKRVPAAVSAIDPIEDSPSIELDASLIDAPATVENSFVQSSATESPLENTALEEFNLPNPLEDFRNVNNFGEKIGGFVEDQTDKIEGGLSKTAESVTRTVETAEGTVQKTVSEIKDKFNPANIPAYIPRFGKQWFLSLIPGGGLLATILAKLAEMPDWLVFTLGFFTGVTTVLFFQLIIKHREKVLDFITKCYELTADPTKNNLIPTPATGLVGFIGRGERRESLTKALETVPTVDRLSELYRQLPSKEREKFLSQNI